VVDASDSEDRIDAAHNERAWWAVLTMNGNTLLLLKIKSRRLCLQFSSGSFPCWDEIGSGADVTVNADQATISLVSTGLNSWNTASNSPVPTLIGFLWAMPRLDKLHL